MGLGSICSRRASSVDEASGKNLGATKAVFTPGSLLSPTAFVCVGTQGCITDAGFDQKLNLASAFTNATPCVATQTTALVKADAPGVFRLHVKWVTACSIWVVP